VAAGVGADIKAVLMVSCEGEYGVPELSGEDDEVKGALA
jgi:hypothetical protein